MYCSACGQALIPGQPVCPQCGRPMAVPVPPIPNLDFQLNNYSGRIRALSIVWFAWGALSLALGAAGVIFANAWLSGAFGPSMRGPLGHTPWNQEHFGPALIHFFWAMMVLRAALCIAAAWGLMERAQWGRVVAIAAACISLIKFPFGTAIGIH